jgi:hypothetical protein
VTPTLSAPERAALEAAAVGGVSGRLREWPLLASAFRALGLPADRNMQTVDMRSQARRALRSLEVQ